MGKATMTYREIRFVIGDTQTRCYVLLEAGGDYPIGVQGWHARTFPLSVACDAILRQIGDAVLWPQEAP